MRLAIQAKRYKYLAVMATLLVGLTLASCSGAGSCTPINGTNPQPQKVDLQLDYIGTIPVLNGAATSSYFYVHNDGDTPISGINYTLANAVSSTAGKHKNALLSSVDVVDGNGFVLKGDSLATCATIAAHSYCPVSFTTPSLTLGNQNNSLLKITVKDANGFSHSFDQVINYSYYNVALNSGVNFATSADVVANITNKRYLMSYLVGGGSAQTYHNVNLQISDSSAMQVKQGFSNGQSVASAELIPVEFSVNIVSEQPTPVNVTPQYVISTTQSTKTNSANAPQATQVASGQSLYVNTSSQTQSAMALKLGVVPIISAPSAEGNAPTIYVSNFGENISGFTVEPASNNVVVYANNCSGVIESNSSCSFKLGTISNTSGSSEVLFKVNGETIFSKVVYYAPAIPSGESAIIISSTPVSQVGISPNQSSSPINIVFSNLGNAPLTNSAIVPQNGGGATALRIINNGCGTTIESQTQCMVQVQIIGGPAGETGNVYLQLTGQSASNNYSNQSNDINYYVITGSTLIISSPVGAESTLNILGNNIESVQSVFTVTNSGTSGTTIKSIGLTGVDVPSALSISHNNCGSSLAANTSCQLTIKYGPLQPESNASGVANLQISYGDKDSILTGTINYSVTALDSHLQITGVSSAGFSGSGSAANPYLGSGCNSIQLSMTITYKNMSDNYVAQNMALNIIDGHVSPYLSVDTSATTCGYGANPKNLGIGQSCNLVLVANRSNMTDNANFILNVNYPSASWNTTQGFVSQSGFSYNGSSTLYANYSQPVLTSTITPSSGLSYTRTLTQTLAGAEGCGSFTTTISAIPYATFATVTSGNCTVNSDLSVICSNNTSQASNVVSYGIDNTIPTPADLFMTFTSQTAGKQIWYNPNILMFHVGS